MHGTLPISEEQALAAMRARPPARVSIAALAREWGWPHDKVSTRLKHWRRSGELPSAAKRRRNDDIAPAPEAAPVPAAVEPAPAAIVAAPVPVIAPPAPIVALPEPTSVIAAPAAASSIAAPPRVRVSRGYGPTRWIGVMVLALVGIALAAIGMIETTNYAASVGGLLFAALAVCADALVLFMPAAIAALWRRRSPAAVLAAFLWLVGGAVTLANLSGYVGGSDDHFRAGRETQSLERTLAFERLARLRHERDAIAETRPAAALRIAFNHARRSRSASLGEALAVAQRRDAVDAELTTLGDNLSSVAALATADPSASVLSELTGATVTEAALRRLRLGLLLLLPLCGGLVLSIALSLVVRRDAPA